FIENRIYRDIEEAETWEEVIGNIRIGLNPFIKHLLRDVTDEDITRLTEIKIKRISKFDSFKADEKINSLEADIAEVVHHLEHLTDFAIAYFKDLKAKYGAGRERRTEERTFDTINKAKVAVANVKLHVSKEEGFIGTGLKKLDSEYVCDCSDIDDIIIFREDGVMMVTKISTKAFVGKNIIHAGVWKKGDKRTVYNLIYSDGKGGKTMMKRFSVTSITRDKEYHITKGTPGSKVLYFSANPNGEAEIVTVLMRQNPRLKKIKFDIDFSDLLIKGRGAGGNMVTKYPVRKVELKEKGVSTLGARKIWFDDTVKRLNVERRGRFLGDFHPDDKILVLLSTGVYKLIGFDLNTHFDESMSHLEKWIPQKPISAVHYDGEKEDYYVKRFLPEMSSKPVSFISEHENSRLVLASTFFHPTARVIFNKKFKITRDKEDELIDLSEFIALKGIKAIGNKLSSVPVTDVVLEAPNEELEASSLAEIIGSESEVNDEAASTDENEKADNSQQLEQGQKKAADLNKEAVEGTPDKPSPTVEFDLGKKDNNSEDDDIQPTLF
ncbi:MAG: DNA gyrase/topoisomerase IV subunit A, partial [Flavobacteriales bacterium]